MSVTWKVTILVNNYTRDSRFMAEHGLTLLFERLATGDLLLLDSGLSGTALLHNARALGVDWKRLHTIVLSHGHYDHTGGLALLMAELQQKITVLCHPNAFQPKAMKTPRFRSIGMSTKEAGLTEEKAVIFYAKNDVSLTDDLWVTGEVPRLVETDKEASAGFFRSEGSLLLEDPVSDDKSIVIRKPGEGYFLLCGCCHSGLVNTLRYIKEKSEDKKLLGILGGIHTVGASPARLDGTIAELKKEKISYLAPIHCSGLREAAVMHHEFGDGIVKFLSVGDSIEI